MRKAGLMALVDDQGRLFGRFNLVDAAVAVLVLGLIPLLYGAAMLFWAPLPKLTAIEPPALTAGPGMRVKIRGENLRPYMRVSFGTHQGRDFLFKSTTEAEVNFDEIPAGVYDVVLYDIAQEQARLDKALTVLPALLPSTGMTLVGVFGNLDEERAKAITPGATIKGIGVVRKVGTPIPARFRVNAYGLIVEMPIEKAVMLPAEVDAFCEVRPVAGAPSCYANGVALQPTYILSGEFSFGKLPFQIDQVRGLAAPEPVEVVARFAAAPSVITQMRVGDVDGGVFANPLAAGATVTAIRVRKTSDALHEAEVDLRVNAERGSNGWSYAGQPLRAGSALVLRSPRYELQGSVADVTPPWTPPSR